MIRLLLVALCAMASTRTPEAAVAGADQLFADGFESGEPRSLAGITAAHNNVRAQLGLPPLVWDTRLAVTAQAWAWRCIDNDRNGVIDHNPDRSVGHPWYVGENIYGSTTNVTGPDAVAAWASESVDYDYASNSCRTGRVCGHYTQLVWRASTHVGCAASFCPSLQFSHAVVCNYGPGGNTGGRPY